MDMLPMKPKYFASSHAGLNGEDDDRPDVGVFGLLGCFFQPVEPPSSSRRFRAGDEGGIFTFSTGLDDIIKPHSFIAILRQCLMRIRS